MVLSKAWKTLMLKYFNSAFKKRMNLFTWGWDFYLVCIKKTQCLWKDSAIGKQADPLAIFWNESNNCCITRTFSYTCGLPVCQGCAGAHNQHIQSSVPGVAQNVTLIVSKDETRGWQETRWLTELLSGFKEYIHQIMTEPLQEGISDSPTIIALL